MPADLFQRMDLDLVYPPFRAKAFDVAAACRARGSDYWATFGFRTIAQSDAMYVLYKAGKGPKAAPGGKSAHNFGLAFDFTLDGEPLIPGLQPVWHSLDYNMLGEEARKAGLAWGGGFGDPPHVGWPGYVSGAQLTPLLAAWEASSGTVLDRLKAVWQVIDTPTENT